MVVETKKKKVLFERIAGSFLLIIIVTAISLAGCKTMNKSQKGAAIGGADGGVVGGVVGRSIGNTAMGAIIGATVGGVGGAIIGRQMDKQAEEIAKEMGDADVIREGEAVVIKFKEQVLFAYDRSDINANAKTSLDTLSGFLNSTFVVSSKGIPLIFTFILNFHLLTNEKAISRNLSICVVNSLKVHGLSKQSSAPALNNCSLKRPDMPVECITTGMSFVSALFLSCNKTWYPFFFGIL